MPRPRHKGAELRPISIESEERETPPKARQAWAGLSSWRKHHEDRRLGLAKVFPFRSSVHFVTLSLACYSREFLLLLAASMTRYHHVLKSIPSGVPALARGTFCSKFGSSSRSTALARVVSHGVSFVAGCWGRFLSRAHYDSAFGGRRSIARQLCQTGCISTISRNSVGESE